MTTLLVLSRMESNASCPTGGVTLRSGLDVNGDNELSELETTQTATVCNGAQGESVSPGAAGIAALLRTDAEPSSTHCATGGFKISTGIDLNSNGVLDDTEIDSTAYVCNGAQGENGSDGQNGLPGSDGVMGYSSLIRLESEPGGPVCPYSGTRILSGV